jgi:hypothetical protein
MENKTMTLFSSVADPVGAAMQLGEAFASSGMFGCTKPAQGQILALQCLASGLTPFEVTATYHLLDGKLSMKSDAMLGKYVRAGGRVQWITRTHERCKARWTFRENDLEMEVTMQELVASGVALGKGGELKDNYRKHPRQMLTARLISEAVRLLAPDVVSGVYTPEEVTDFSPAAAQPIADRPMPLPVLDALTEQKSDVSDPVAPPTVEAEVIEDIEDEFKTLLGAHYGAALAFFKVERLTSLSTRVQQDIRNRTEALIKKISTK